MNDREKIQAALSMLQGMKWGRESWLSNAMRIDEVVQMLQAPGNDRTGAGEPSAAVSSRPRAGLSDRLIALLGKHSGSARPSKIHLTGKK